MNLSGYQVRKYRKNHELLKSSWIWVDTKPENIAKISNYSKPHEYLWFPSSKISLKSVTTQIPHESVSIPSPKMSLKSVNTQIPHESGLIPSPKISLKSVTTQILMDLCGYKARKYIAKISTYSNPSWIWVNSKPEIIAKISNYSNPHESVWIPSQISS